MFGRPILAREPVQLPDAAADQTYALLEATLRGPIRAQAAVPLLRGGEAMGAINISRRETGEFSPAKIGLSLSLETQSNLSKDQQDAASAFKEKAVERRVLVDTQAPTTWRGFVTGALGIHVLSAGSPQLQRLAQHHLRLAFQRMEWIKRSE
jgi:hypothetical protein